MKKKLMRLRDEAAMHRERYETYKDSQDEWLRRKVTCDLDRFLMEHREAAIILVTEALEREVNRMPQPSKANKPKASWWRRITTNTVRP